MILRYLCANNGSLQYTVHKTILANYIIISNRLGIAYELVNENHCP